MPGIKLYFLLLFVLGQRFAINSQNGVRESLAADYILGGWTCFEIYRDYTNSSSPYLEGTKSTQYVQEHWYITSDSIFQLEYPCKIGNRNAYKILSDSIFYDGLNKGFYHVKFRNDTMILNGGYAPLYIKKFTRTNFDIKIIEKLKRNLINLDCYIGKAKIKRYTVDEKGRKKDLKFPVKMPEYINVPDVKTASEIESKNNITLIIDGQQREFGILIANWYASKKDPKIKNKLIWKQKTSFIVYPRNWWKDEPFEVIYQQE